jgi:hypothetical protein
VVELAALEEARAALVEENGQLQATLGVAQQSVAAAEERVQETTAHLDTVKAEYLTQVEELQAREAEAAAAAEEASTVAVAALAEAYGAAAAAAAEAATEAQERAAAEAEAAAFSTQVQQLTEVRGRPLSPQLAAHRGRSRVGPASCVGSERRAMFTGRSDAVVRSALTADRRGRRGTVRWRRRLRRRTSRSSTTGCRPKRTRMRSR